MFVTITVTWLERFKIGVTCICARCSESLPGRTGIRQRTLDKESILVDVLLVARIGDRGEQGLGEDLRAFFRRELENRQRLIHSLPAINSQISRSFCGEIRTKRYAQQLPINQFLCPALRRPRPARLDFALAFTRMAVKSPRR